MKSKSSSLNLPKAGSNCINEQAATWKTLNRGHRVDQRVSLLENFRPAASCTAAHGSHRAQYEVVAPGCAAIGQRRRETTLFASHPTLITSEQSSSLGRFE